MKKLLVLGLMSVAPWCLAAEQTRDVADFKSISSQGVYKLVVNVGKKQSVVVSSADDTILGKLVTKVVGDELVISMPDVKNHKTSDKVTIAINVAELTKFQMEGAGDTELNSLKGDRFELKYQGVGRLTANGKVERFVMSMEGVGMVNTRELDAKHADVRLEGVGSAKVRATESLTAKVDGVGSLTYYGHPARIKKSVDGIGSVSAGD